MSWATIKDLYARFGEEYVNKLGIRRNFDLETDSYVASEDCKSVKSVLETALADAKQLILYKLACKFKDYEKVNTTNFSIIKQWHIKTTIEILKVGGDCTSCDCEGLDGFINCGTVCTDDGVCLKKKVSGISVSVPKYPCEGCKGECKCCA